MATHGPPRPAPEKRVGAGLIHPAEWAANVSHLRESYALEKALAERRGKGKDKWNNDPAKGKDKKGKCKKEGYAASGDGSPP